MVNSGHFTLANLRETGMRVARLFLLTGKVLGVKESVLCICRGHNTLSWSTVGPTNNSHCSAKNAVTFTMYGKRKITKGLSLMNLDSLLFNI